MKTLKTFTMILALAVSAVPSFASINYNASKSNTGNVTVKNQKTQKTQSAAKANAASSHSNTQHN